MDPSSEIDWLLLTAYFSGETTAQQDAEIRAWIAAAPGRGVAIDALRQRWDAVQLSAVAVDSDAHWNDFARGVLASPRKPIPQVVPVAHRRQFFGRHTNMRRALAGAMAAAMVCAIGGVAYWAGGRGEHTNVPSRTFTTAAGKRAEFTLRDGTRVVLAPQSTLTMDGSVGTLVGEAFFTVTHQANRAFAVRTGNVTTRVLGTAFAVRRYADDTTTRVVVTEGKVAVTGAGTRTLTAGAVAYVTDSTINALRVDDPAQLTSWTQGQLLFNNARADEVLTAVERWYGVTFRLTDSTLKSYRLYTALDTRRSRSETVAALESVLNVHATAVGDTITLTPRAGAVRRAIPRTNSLFTPSSGAGR